MKISKTLYVTNRDDWRAWLERNHEGETEVWLIYYKKHTGRPRIPYDDAVEEALCFGWIDSTVKRIDDETFAQRFTPRKDNSNWSELNKKRLGRLMKEGKVTEAGLAKIDGEVLDRPQQKSKEFVIPPYFKKALMANKAAWKNFNNLAPSYQRNYVGWVTSAKKEETRTRRLQEAVELLALNKKLGMK